MSFFCKPSHVRYIELTISISLIGTIDKTCIEMLTLHEGPSKESVRSCDNHRILFTP